MSTTSATAAAMSELGLDTVAELAAQLRVDSIRSSTSAGSGHPTSSMYAADLLTLAWAGIDADHIAGRAEELVERCRLLVARFKTPRAIYVEDSLPKNPVGKIDKPSLRRRVARA